MKYKAVVKSVKEIIGRDCESFTIHTEDGAEEGYFHYTTAMNNLAGQKIVIEKSDDEKYDYMSEKHRWLEGWLEDLKTLTLQDEFEDEMKMCFKTDAVAYWYEYSKWLERKFG